MKTGQCFHSLQPGERNATHEHTAYRHLQALYVSIPFNRESATQLNELEAAKVEPLDLFPFPSNGIAQLNLD